MQCLFSFAQKCVLSIKYSYLHNLPLLKLYTKKYIPKERLAHTKNKKRGDNIFTFSKQGMVGIGLAL
jgi:hypothetical protein